MTQNLASFLSRTEVWLLALGAAAFLALYWALRGAPIGQAVEDEADEAPSAAYRDRVIAAVVAGLLLVLAGGYVALTRSVAWSIPAFAVGFGIVLTLIAFNQRYRHASPALRRTVEFSNMALTATLVAGVLIVVNVLAFRYGGRALDFTRERAFSLAPQTVKQLSALDRPVTFTLLFGDSPRAAHQSDRVQQLLELYKVANPRMVRVAQVNPFREPEKYEALVKRIPGVAVTQGGGVLVEYGEGDKATHSVIRNVDLFDMPASSRFEDDTARFETSFRGEDALTSAVISLREGRRPKILFTTGHGEPSLDSTDPRSPGLGVWQARLAALGSDATQVNLIQDDLPADAALVVVVAPRSPFKPDEVAKLRAFLDRGGPALLLAGNQDPTGLDELLRSYNVEYGRGVILDRRLSLRGRASVIYVPVGGSLRHPIVDSLATRLVLMPNAAPLRPLGFGGGASPNPNLMATPILRTTNQSWAETDLAKSPPEFNQGADERGPLTVGVAVSDRPKPGEPPEGRPRLVVLSSGAMGDNFILESEPTDQDLLMNAISWLRGRADLTGITPKTHVALTLMAEPVLRFRLVMVPTVMALILIIGLGVSTYLARRE